MQGSELFQIVADIFARCFYFLQTPLWYLGTRPITLWNICISILMVTIFVDFLNIIGIWGYGEDYVDYDARDD